MLEFTVPFRSKWYNRFWNSLNGYTQYEYRKRERDGRNVNRAKRIKSL